MIFCEISSFTLVAPSIYSDSYNCALCAALGLGKPDEEDEEEVLEMELEDSHSILLLQDQELDQV